MSVRSVFPIERLGKLRDIIPRLDLLEEQNKLLLSKIEKLNKKIDELKDNNLLLQEQCDCYAMMHGEILSEIEKLAKKII